MGRAPPSVRGFGSAERPCPRSPAGRLRRCLLRLLRRVVQVHRQRVEVLLQPSDIAPNISDVVVDLVHLGSVGRGRLNRTLSLGVRRDARSLWST